MCNKTIIIVLSIIFEYLMTEWNRIQLKCLLLTKVTETNRVYTILYYNLATSISNCLLLVGNTSVINEDDVVGTEAGNECRPTASAQPVDDSSKQSCGEPSNDPGDYLGLY
jgi:hypothetical protein